MTEYVDVVDDNDQVIGKTTIKEASDNVIRTRASRVLILNNENELLLQKRPSTKLRYPDFWDIGIAERLISGEEYKDAAIRGLGEELNITNVMHQDLDFLFKLKFDNEITKRWYGVFSLFHDKKIIPNKKETAEIKFIPQDKLISFLRTEKIMEAGLKTFEIYKK